MSSKLFVGNLDFNTAEDQLRDAFAEFGQLVAVSIITDRDTGRSRGFGFVEYNSPGDAQKAIDTMNGTLLDGRTLNVNLARERAGGERAGGGNGHRGGRQKGGGRRERW